MFKDITRHRQTKLITTIIPQSQIQILIPGQRDIRPGIIAWMPIIMEKISVFRLDRREGSIITIAKEIKSMFLKVNRKQNDYNKTFHNMKKYLISLILILFMQSFVTAQTLTVNDLYILHSIKDLKQIDYYLTPKGFKSVGLLEKNTAEGWDIYQFSGNQEKLEVGIGSQFNGNGELSDAILIQYYIKNEMDFKTFLNLLEKEGFKQYIEGVLYSKDKAIIENKEAILNMEDNAFKKSQKHKNGFVYSYYVKEEEIKMVCVTKANDYFEISILY